MAARSIKPTVWIEPKPPNRGPYRIRAEFNGRRLPDIPVGMSAKHAEQKRAEREAELWAGRLGIAEPTKVTVFQWRDEYLAVCKEQNPDSYENFDKRAIESLAAFVGDIPIRALDGAADPQGAQQLLRDWKKHLEAAGGVRHKKPVPLNPTTVRMRMAHASAGLSWARRRGWIVLNAFEQVEMPKGNKNERVIEAAEIKIIYEEILPREHHGWFTTLLWTGLRKDELVGLSKRQVIRGRTAEELWRLVFSKTQTKNKKAKAVELHPQAQVEVERAMAASRGDQVFERLTDHKVEHWFKRIQERLGDVTPHTLKHTFCTRFMEATGDLDSLALMTGNSRRSLELHYIHLSRARPRAVLTVDFGYAPPALPQNADQTKSQ